MAMSRRTFLSGSAATLAGLGLSAAAPQGTPRPRRILLLAGPASHAYGEHEHPAGCALLADLLGRLEGVEAEAVVGWPEDASVLAKLDALIVFGDGAEQHPLNGHFDALAPHVRRGLGLGLLHYALIVEGERPQAQLVDWIGGRYELHWSVNPHWTARMDPLPDHPISRGVAPFVIEDEWYYHMRFRPELAGVVPLLTTLPTAQSLSRPDGPHSGNPHVRKAVLEEQQRQHLAWCTQPEVGGRGFGFTGLHWHWNLAHDGLRTLLLNAACWLAGREIPNGGVASERPTLDDLVARAGSPPEGFDRAAVGERLARFRQE